MIKIRAAVTQDKASVLTLLKQRGLFNDMELRVAEEVFDEAFKNKEPVDYHVFCSLNEAGQVVGYICFGPVPLTDGCFDLYWIVVDEAYAGKGIGRDLLRNMEHHVRRQHARHIYVETSSTSGYVPARAFYQKHGFKSACVLPDFYRKGDDKLIFMKVL
jgi:ribosomal protein S18 acetylase RimI-like enzyme